MFLLKYVATMVLVLSFAACLNAGEARIIRTIIGTDGTYKEGDLVALTDRFNQEAIEETGIQIEVIDTVSYVPKDTDRNKVVIDWGDFLWNQKKIYDIAILFINDSFLGAATRSIIPVPQWLGLTDTGIYQYIVLKGTNYRRFKHEVYHVFHPGHDSGIMSAIQEVGIVPFVNIPITSTSLSEHSKDIIEKNKWREFRTLDNLVHWEDIRKNLVR